MIVQNTMLIKSDYMYMYTYIIIKIVWFSYT